MHSFSLDHLGNTAIVQGVTGYGEVAERSIAAVLKTARPVRPALHFLPVSTAGTTAYGPRRTRKARMMERFAMAHNQAQAYDPAIAWRNACDGLEGGPFVAAVAAAVSNDGEIDGGRRWLLDLAVGFLRDQKRAHGVWNAYDFAEPDFAAINEVWPIMGEAAGMFDGDLDARAILPTLARFVAERLPGIWARPAWRRHEPLTRTIILADRTHDLVGLFTAGLKPNGSKDPFALRRAANHWLMQVVCPLTVGTTPPQRGNA